MLFTEFLREGSTRTLRFVRTRHADLISVSPRVWHPLVRCRSGVQDLETTSGHVPAFSTCWFDSGYKFASVYGALRITTQCLVRQ